MAFRSSKGVADEDAELMNRPRTETMMLFWKFLFTVVEFFMRLCDLSVWKRGLKEPEVRVFSLKIRELDGNLGDIHSGGWDCWFFSYVEAGELSHLPE